MSNSEIILENIVKIVKNEKNSDIGFSKICSYLSENFPELKENEDEKIKKALISILKSDFEKNTTIFDISVEKIITWLEKQDELTNINPSEFHLRLYKLLKQFETLPKEELTSSLSFFLNVVQNDGTYKDEEKQGEQKPTLPRWKYKKDDTPLLRDSLILNKYGCVAKSPSGAVVSDVWILDYEELAKLPKEEPEKQDYEFQGIAKSRPAKGTLKKLIDGIEFPFKAKVKKNNKIVTIVGGQLDDAKSGSYIAYSSDKTDGYKVYKPEDLEFQPKYKVGDYLVNKYCKGKVIALTDDAYVLDTGQGMPFSHEHNIHLWTIQEAKDGEILACKDILMIFRKNEVLSHNYILTYCTLTGDDLKIDTTVGNVKPTDIHPATTTQRNHLLSTIKKKGYVWSAKDKRISRFPKGCWIVDGLDPNDTKVAVIKDIGKSVQYYLVEYTNGILVKVDPSYVDKYFSPWNLNNAHQGEILVKGNIILIFKWVKTDSYTKMIISSCFYDINGGFYPGGEFPIEPGEKIIPADKDQRNLLLSEIKAANYEWDSATNTLSGGINECEDALDQAIIAIEDVMADERENNSYAGHRLPFKRVKEVLEDIKKLLLKEQ